MIKHYKYYKSVDSTNSLILFFKIKHPLIVEGHYIPRCTLAAKNRNGTSFAYQFRETYGDFFVFSFYFIVFRFDA